MKRQIDILRDCLYKESEALKTLADSIDTDSIEFAKAIAECKGKIVFTGVGKSFIVASKISGTLSSIGVSSIPINPLPMLHGDLGFLDSDDTVIALSNSGETDLLIEVLNCVKTLNVRILSLTGNRNSTIARMSYKSVEIKTEEAGPFGLVPTTSTTAMMAFGDALACLLVEILGLTMADFHRNHPNGELSKTI